MGQRTHKRSIQKNKKMNKKNVITLTIILLVCTISAQVIAQTHTQDDDALFDEVDQFLAEDSATFDESQPLEDQSTDQKTTTTTDTSSPIRTTTPAKQENSTIFLLITIPLAIIFISAIIALTIFLLKKNKSPKMTSPQVKQYIREATKNGMNYTSIAQQLTQQGWDIKTIQKAYNEVANGI